jgi:hypothetical protein
MRSKDARGLCALAVVWFLLIFAPGCGDPQGSGGDGGSAGSGGVASSGGTGGTGGTGGSSTTITITSLPATDDDGDYYLEWSATGSAGAPWTVQEDDTFLLHRWEVWWLDLE